MMNARLLIVMATDTALAVNVNAFEATRERCAKKVRFFFSRYTFLFVRICFVEPPHAFLFGDLLYLLEPHIFNVY